MKTNQCSPCGRHFAGMTSFDAHQASDNTTGALTCKDPGDIKNAGMRLTLGTDGVWHGQATERSRERFAAISARRSAKVSELAA